MIVEIVVEDEVLVVVNAMVELERELIAALGLYGHGLNSTAAGRSGDKLKQIDGSGVHASQRNLVVGKNGGVCDGNARCNRCPTNSGYGCLASRTLPRLGTCLKRICVIQHPSKRGFCGKISNHLTIHCGISWVGTPRSRRHEHSGRGDSPTT